MKSVTENQGFYEEAWNNQACLGYVVLAAKKMNFTEGETRELIDSVRIQFGKISVEEAGKIYYKSNHKI